LYLCSYKKRKQKEKEAMKVRINRWYNALVTALLSMLGISSCGGESGEAACEYGTPYVDYQVKGIVTDEAGTPIKGIRVSVPYAGGESEAGLSTETDASGQYVLQEFTSYHNDCIVFEDIDGDANGGQFLSETVDIEEMSKVQLEKGGEGWYGGKYEVTANMKLQKKP